MKFYKAGEIPDVGNMYFIFGDGGTGKTSLTKQFEGRKLLISFDGSTNAIADTEDVDVIAFEDSDAPKIQALLLSYLKNQIYTTDDNGQQSLKGTHSTIIWIM